MESEESERYSLLNVQKLGPGGNLAGPHRGGNDCSALQGESVQLRLEGAGGLALMALTLSRARYWP
jgi:hypothetical protein